LNYSHPTALAHTISGPHPLYGIVNNAAVAEGDSRTIFATNVDGVKNVVDAFKPLMDPLHGRIVNVSSGECGESRTGQWARGEGKQRQANGRGARGIKGRPMGEGNDWL
jgi:NAD(P)-dependent dehydrogenase (short-subunit alcohol dehydrogenase family)